MSAKASKRKPDDSDDDDSDDEDEYHVIGDEEDDDEDEDIVEEDDEEGDAHEDTMEDGEGATKKTDAGSGSANVAVARPSVWRPGVDDMESDEELEYDPSAYDCLHAWSLEWPCLSFDVVRDDLGDNRAHFPHSMFLVSGSQADKATHNALTVMKITRLAKTKKTSRRGGEDASASESESESEDDETDAEGRANVTTGPLLQTQAVAHHGSVNRVRCMPQQSSIAATWAETGHVQVWDLAAQMERLIGMTADTATAANAVHRLAPRHIFTGHKDEGYALDWSPASEGARFFDFFVNDSRATERGVPFRLYTHHLPLFFFFLFSYAGRLATGDCARAIHVWTPGPAGKWTVSASPYLGHDGSVEDIQWSPVRVRV